MSTPSPARVDVRPPWPDELPRLAEAFPGLPWAQAMHLRIAAVRATPERMAGVAAITVSPEQNCGTLHVIVRPRFARSAVMDALCRAALAAARSANVVRLEFSPHLTSSDSRIEPLVRAGFRVAEAEGGIRLHWDAA